MQKINILEKLNEYNLTIYPINALKNEASSYTLAIFQPLENVIANDNEVKNENTTSIESKYSSFFTQVNEHGRELVLSPEYSCPWTSLLNQFTDNFPLIGALWVLGCESITIDLLKKIIEDNNADDIQFICEDLSSLDTLGDKNFLDPLAYCFNAKDENNNRKKIVVIQFKRRPMVDHGVELEKDHLILGKNYYEFRNDDSSVRLITLICSESINYDLELDSQKAYLIPHLQLNTNPFHASFMNYRLNAFIQHKNVEYICVNWARGFKINSSNESKYGGSAYYLHSEKIKDDDNRMNENHKKGIYYSYSMAHHYHRYSLNYDEHIFYVKTNQILQNQTANINQSRFGIEAIKIFHWETNCWNECSNCDDGWQHKLNDIGHFDRVSFLLDYSPMAKERFLNITTGVSLSKDKCHNWYCPKCLKSFHLNSDEAPSTLSVFFDPQNMQDLTQVTGKINWLKRYVLNGAVTYPSKFSDLQDINNFTVHEDASKSHINIENNQSGATFVGLGNDSEVNAKKVYSNIADAIKADQRKLIVWYQEDTSEEIQSYSENRIKIDDDFTESRKSITNDMDEE